VDGLGINLPGLITQFVNFGILLAILWILLFKPLQRVLDERKRRIEEGLKASESAQEAAEDAKVGAEAEVQRGREEAQALVAQAQEIAQRVQAEAQEGAGREAEAIVERARLEIQQERDQAIAELRSEFADLAITAAERVLGEAVDRTQHQRLIDEVLAESAFSADPSRN
jgi:F-type H+-transporting ATPase subunit b